MNVLEKIIHHLSPSWGSRRAEARLSAERYEIARNILSDYSPTKTESAYSAASYRTSIGDWDPPVGDADATLLYEVEPLRHKSQDMYRKSATARGVIDRIVTGVVGSGLTLRSTIDGKYLGLSDDQAREWDDAAEREFGVWSDSKDCDFTRQQDFKELQKLLLKSQLLRGDSYGLMPFVPREGQPYDLRLQAIEADRITNPNNNADDENIAGGIERNSQGIPVAIHVQSRHPGNRFTNIDVKWTRIPFYGSKTKRRQVVRLMTMDRIDQSRGEPILAPVLNTLKQLGRYSDAELTSAVVNASLTVFIKRPLESQGSWDRPAVTYTPEQKAAWARRVLTLGPGNWVDGMPGEDLEIINATRPSNQFDPFFTACVKQIGMGLGVPFEILMQHFSASYSASRAALLEFFKLIKTLRASLVSNLCQPVYVEFLTEAILKGRLYAPGFLEDSMIRAAYCKNRWMGPSMGQVDPVKEVQAASMRINNHLSNYGQECAEISGNDFEQNVYIKAKEEALLRKNKMTVGSLAPFADDPKPNEGDQDAA